MRAIRVSAASLMAGGLLAVAVVAPASAVQDEIGTPGDKNCVGQTMSFLAQGYGGFNENGIGNVADAADLSVKEVKEVVTAYCDGTP